MTWTSTKYVHISITAYTLYILYTYTSLYTGSVKKMYRINRKNYTSICNTFVAFSIIIDLATITRKISSFLPIQPHYNWLIESLRKTTKTKMNIIFSFSTIFSMKPNYLRLKFLDFSNRQVDFIIHCSTCYHIYYISFPYNYFCLTFCSFFVGS